MTGSEFDAVLRAALLDANWADFSAVWEGAREAPEFSPRFMAWEQTFFASPFACARRKTRPMWKKVLRAAACILLALSLALGAAMLNPSARARIVHTVETWFAEYTSFTFTGPAHWDAPPGDWRPAYVPEGFSETDCVVRGRQTHVTYENAEGAFIDLFYMPAAQGAKISLDNEHSDHEQIAIGEHTADLFKSNTEGYFSDIIWVDEDSGIAFWIYSKIDYHELIDMAESIEPLS